MTQHNTLNVKLSNSQFNKSKTGIKNGIEVTLNLSNFEILMMKLIFCINYY